MRFACERAAEHFEEARPLLEANWREVARYPDILLDVDWESYRRLEEAGCLRAFSARSDEGVLRGYAIFLVQHNAHYRRSLQAVQDVVYIDQAHRGGGLAFLRWCDEQLRAEGVQVVYHHVKASHPWGAALERMGYELVDLIYGRRLDR